jgi:putative Ca2+/H+ antiporter (TMEM165/GDT1 family)
MAFWGVVLFVFLPLPASGSIGGTFVGQFIGLTRTSGAVAVVLAGALVSALFAGLAIFMGAKAQEMLRNPWLTAGSVVLFAAFAWIAWVRTKRALQSK